PIAQQSPSLSFVVAHFALPHAAVPRLPSTSVGWFPGGSVERSFAVRAPLAEAADLALGVVLPSALDPTIAPAERAIVALHCPCAATLAADWTSGKEELARALARRAAAVVPALARDAELLSVATPHTMWRYTRNESGAAYGFAHTPQRFALLRALREE